MFHSHTRLIMMGQWLPPSQGAGQWPPPVPARRADKPPTVVIGSEMPKGSSVTPNLPGSITHLFSFSPAEEGRDYGKEKSHAFSGWHSV
jgi:hypothetical protein